MSRAEPEEPWLSQPSRKLRETYPLSTIHYPLPTIHYPLPTTHYPLPTIHYPLPTTHLLHHATTLPARFSAAFSAGRWCEDVALIQRSVSFSAHPAPHR